jgi:hypothetical protein
MKMSKADNGLWTPEDKIGLNGIVVVELHDERGKLKHYEEVVNRITDVGDQYYAERATGIGSPPAQVTGMRLGKGGATAASKTGAGAAIVTYITASQVAISSGPTSSQPGGATTARRIAWVSTWAAGIATDTGITEVVITNETPLTNVAGTAANTIARAVLTTFDKGAGDTLTITWNHDLLGA